MGAGFDKPGSAPTEVHRLGSLGETGYRCTMPHRQSREEWMGDISERQRNIVFPDTVRNAGGFWRGIQTQRLNSFQWFGMALLLLFYITLFVLLVQEIWPSGPVPTWKKILFGYGPYLNLLLAAITVLLTSALPSATQALNNNVVNQSRRP